METQSMTGSSNPVVRERHWVDRNAVPEEGAGSPGQEFLRLFASLFNGQASAATGDISSILDLASEITAATHAAQHAKEASKAKEVKATDRAEDEEASTDEVDEDDTVAAAAPQVEEKQAAEKIASDSSATAAAAPVQAAPAAPVEHDEVEKEVKAGSEEEAAPEEDAAATVQAQGRQTNSQQTAAANQASTDAEANEVEADSKDAVTAATAPRAAQKSQPARKQAESDEEMPEMTEMEELQQSSTASSQQLQGQPPTSAGKDVSAAAHSVDARAAQAGAVAQLVHDAIAAIKPQAAGTPFQAVNALASGGGIEESAKKPAAPKAQTAAQRSQQDKIIEQIQQALESASKSKDGNTVVFRLDPPELGKLTVKVTQRSDQLYARIIPENAEVERVLRERLPEVTNVLAAQGFKTENVQVSIGIERSESEMFQFNQSGDRASGKQAGSESSRHEGTSQGPAPERTAAVRQPAPAGWIA